MNLRSFFDFGTSSQFLTFTTLKSDFEKVSKSTNSSNSGSTFTFYRSSFTANFSSAALFAFISATSFPIGFIVI